MKLRVLASMAAAAATFVAPAASAAGPAKKTPELLAKGKASFAVNCASCHGAAGAGDGVAAAALNPKPRNLVKEPLKNGSKPEQIFETLEKGVPGTAMVAFKHLPEEERWALAYYVHELRGAKK